MATELNHGVYTTYTSQGCRCSECREAARLYNVKRKAQRFAWVKANGLPSSIAHGRSAYSNWGCRCDICTADSVRVNREYRQNKRKKQLSAR